MEDLVARRDNLEAPTNTLQNGRDSFLRWLVRANHQDETFRISYAGLLSMLFADLDREDPRVKAAVGWIQRHYTLEENPGLEQQSLFFYYHTMAKALTAYGMGHLETDAGQTIHWRQKLLEKLLSLQKEDGRWVNDNARWMENDPCLVTAYVLLTLEMILKSDE